MSHDAVKGTCDFTFQSSVYMPVLLVMPLTDYLGKQLRFITRVHGSPCSLHEALLFANMMIWRFSHDAAPVKKKNKKKKEIEKNNKKRGWRMAVIHFLLLHWSH